MKRIIILGLLLIIGLISCEPVGGGYGYQYLGRVDCIQFKCDRYGEYTSIVTVYPDIFVVSGKIDIPGKQNAYVWVNLFDKTLRLRGLNRISAEYFVIHCNRMDFE